MPTVSGVVVPTGGQSEQRRTLLDIVDELARPIDADDSTIRAYAADSFRSAVRRMNRKGLWPWEHQEEDLTVTKDQKFSTVTGAIKKPLAMHYLDSAGGTRNEKIEYMSYDRFLEMYSVAFSTRPFAYTIPNMFETGQIRWVPTPATSYNARFSYYRVTPAPRNEQEAVEIPDLAIEAYMSWAWYELLKRMPSEGRPYPIAVALADATASFREISAHVNVPGDRTRAVAMSLHGGFR